MQKNEDLMVSGGENLGHPPYWQRRSWIDCVDGVSPRYHHNGKSGTPTLLTEA